jgi:aspartyl-tRNA(Asn)/glutamyl-tRNA(Gln) amidotransferase subunit A
VYGAGTGLVHPRDEAFKSFVFINESAIATARAIDLDLQGGHWRGPLHGIPIGIKDNYLTCDMPTTAGTKAPGVDFPLVDSAAVRGCAPPGRF